MTDDKLTGPSTRYKAMLGGDGQWRPGVATTAEKGGRFWTRESAQAYCDWRNGGIDARKAEGRRNA